MRVDSLVELLYYMERIQCNIHCSLVTIFIGACCDYSNRYTLLFGLFGWQSQLTGALTNKLVMYRCERSSWPREAPIKCVSTSLNDTLGEGASPEYPMEAEKILVLA